MAARVKTQPGYSGSVRLLLADRFAPTTNEIGFLECGRERVVSFFVGWQNSVVLAATGRTAVAREVPGGLETALAELLPLTTPRPVRHLFVPTQNGWTAYFNNFRRGTDSSSTRYMARSLACRGLRIVATPHTTRKQGAEHRGRWGATILEIYAPREVKIHNTLRSIYAANDGGRWVFGADGEVQPFENVAAYAQARIRDRFTPEMLRDYSEALGVRPFDDSFYMPEGAATLVEETGRMPSRHTTYTLADEQAKF
jgi:hypothetical protein